MTSEHLSPEARVLLARVDVPAQDKLILLAALAYPTSVVARTASSATQALAEMTGLPLGHVQQRLDRKVLTCWTQGPPEGTQGPPGTPGPPEASEASGQEVR